MGSLNNPFHSLAELFHFYALLVEMKIQKKMKIFTKSLSEYEHAATAIFLYNVFDGVE